MTVKGRGIWWSSLMDKGKDMFRNRTQGDNFHAIRKTQEKVGMKKK